MTLKARLESWRPVLMAAAFTSFRDVTDPTSWQSLRGWKINSARPRPG